MEKQHHCTTCTKPCNKDTCGAWFVKCPPKPCETCIKPLYEIITYCNVKEKELTWIPFKKAFHDAVGVPGVPRGYTTQFRGFSDVGKSTGIYESLAGAQKLGDYCIIIDTEGSFNWEHAKLVGFKFEEIIDEDGVVVDYDGPDFMYFGGSDLLALYQNYDYKDAKMKTEPQRFIPVVEDIAKLINEILDKPAKGEFPHNITFLWD